MKNIVISFTWGTRPDVSCHIPAFHTQEKKVFTILTIFLTVTQTNRYTFRPLAFFLGEKDAEVTISIYTREEKRSRIQ